MAEVGGDGEGVWERVSKVSESDLTLRMVSLEWDLSLIWPLNDQMLFTRGSEDKARNWA
jgi:hypothetical protein